MALARHSARTGKTIALEILSLMNSPRAQTEFKAAAGNVPSGDSDPAVQGGFVKVDRETELETLFGLGGVLLTIIAFGMIVSGLLGHLDRHTGHYHGPEA